MKIFFNDIVGWTGVVLTVLLALPQILKMIKNKKGELPLISFSVLGIGIFFWILFGLFTPAKNSWDKPIQAIVANFLSFGLVGITFFLYLKYKGLKMISWIQSIVATTFMVIILILIILGIWRNWTIQENGLNIIGVIAVSGTSLAFLPQTIKTFIKKDITGISFFVLIIGFLVNFTWELFWGYIAFTKGFNIANITILVFQIIAMIIYILQMGLYLKINQKNKKI